MWGAAVGDEGEVGGNRAAKGAWEGHGEPARVVMEGGVQGILVFSISPSIHPRTPEQLPTNQSNHPNRQRRLRHHRYRQYRHRRILVCPPFPRRWSIFEAGGTHIGVSRIIFVCEDNLIFQRFPSPLHVLHK